MSAPFISGFIPFFFLTGHISIKNKTNSYEQIKKILVKVKIFFPIRQIVYRKRQKYTYVLCLYVMYVYIYISLTGKTSQFDAVEAKKNQISTFPQNFNI